MTVRYYNLYFSPTGGTKKVALALAKGFAAPFEEIDLIKQPEKLQEIQFEKDDVCLVAVPAYGGRIPAGVAELFAQVSGMNAKVAPIAVFGNRAIDDTLSELQDVLEREGFVCVAGVEAAAEHSLMRQFAKGRPDQEDEQELMRFGAQIREKLSDSKGGAMKLPGSHGQYKKYGGVPLKPRTSRKCAACGLCAKECPAQAIPKDNPRITDREKCISCMHCVSVCPRKARSFSRLLSGIAAQKMKKSCMGRKENKLYL